MSYTGIPFDQMSLMPTVCNHNVRHGVGGGQVNEANWPAANRALFTPIRLHSPTWARRIIWAGGNTTGSVDVGIYRRDGTLVASGGGQANQNGVVKTTITATLLPPGDYYLALSCSSASGSILVSAPSGVGGRGLVQMASAYPLPATATFTQTTNDIYPAIGLMTLASDL
jgi:hypothetical protein